jgi:hypothetical protein
VTEGPVATATEGPVATITEGPVATATPEGPVATVTEVPVATSTPEPQPTSTPITEACGNNVVDASEDCDPPGSSSCPNAGNGLEVCSMACTCNCPTRISFTGDASDPLSVLDTGWTGIAHRAPIISGGSVTVAADCPATGRPCGTCATSGPIPNTQAGQIQSQRCSNDPSIHCTDDTPCTGGTCEFFFGSNLPLAAGGVTTCVVNQFNGPVTGSANIETGEAITTALLTARLQRRRHRQPVSALRRDPTVNDGPARRNLRRGAEELNCDANGDVPGRPDFGQTSLDCPPNPAAVIATLPINLTSATDPVTRALTANSPNCTNSTGDKCLCDTCNNAAATPCTSNADCPDPAGPIAGICGGRRCLSGPNSGAACTVASECPRGSCARPGEPTKPSGCVDDTTVSDRVLECDDPDGDGEGQCTIGPIDQNCTLASGHAQRGCTGDGDCGGAPGSCESINRRCFRPAAALPDDGQNDGMDTLTAIGMEDAPMNDVSHPTLVRLLRD